MDPRNEALNRIKREKMTVSFKTKRVSIPIYFNERQMVKNSEDLICSLVLVFSF